ncbi:MAG: hypothetical protein NAG76_01330 [Candidatus Pristimantibacillus lignocellulolyticus]|uniref:Uncharacterized protein n=1 Tax=Candidatus Pristimantibacillus lignocellulolyticus TaxID=2994561 RepID=A0A9J6ZGE5_9BACL|nr:MAG: hypothetical protein NAG76_01330 [Candidatus Pristimantibacillus lignocellulolyticus]
MFTLQEKQFLLQLLKSKTRFGWFNRKKKQAMQQELIEKLEQMVRNEQVNKSHL